ncbi:MULTISPECIES: IS481 family transposase [Arthrobacter]
MSHPNAILGPKGRLLLAQRVVDSGWPLRRAAERFQVSVPTAQRWAHRYREHGEHGMEDHSSRPHRSPRQLPVRRERRIIGIRVNRRWGPARIAYKLGMHPSTVHRVLSRYGLAKLSWQDRATGRTVRRYEHENPGDMVHVDIKKLGRIPDGGGHRALGRAAGNRNKTGTASNRKPGYAYLHHVVDDHSRLVYSEELPDEKKETAAGFWNRANSFFNDAGIDVKRVLTDNGSCYRSHAFKDALGEDIKHKRTRPYRPQTNGKVERFNRTLLEEWAYAQEFTSEAERSACYQDYIDHYNHHRGHTALGGKSPSSRVTNLAG